MTRFYAPTREDQEEWVFFIKEAFDIYKAEATKKRGRTPPSSTLQ
jgi:hypothetical protein